MRKTFSRYSATRRDPPKPKPFIGFGAYRLVMKGVVGYVIGPDGKRCEPLQRWARDLLEGPPDVSSQAGARPLPRNHDPLSELRRLTAARDAIRALLDAINWAHATRPEVLADLLHAKPGKAREVILYWLRLRGCTIKKGRGRNGGRIVTPGSADEQWLIGVTISRFRDLFDFWHDAGIRVAHNPMQMDPDRSRLAAGETRKVKKSSLRWWLDVDGLFRTRHVERQAPRPGDPAIALKILERGREHGWPEELLLKYEGMYLMGAREGQLDAATAYGLLVTAKSENHIRLIQKGTGGLLSWHARMPHKWRAKVLDMLDRRMRDQGGLATLKRWAKSRDNADHERLRRIFIFSTDGDGPMPRWKSAHLLRLAVESLDLSFVIQRDDGSLVTKWFTSHWFRHMFVNRLLDAIAESAFDQAQKDRARENLAHYMGWKNPAAMLRYYGRQHFDDEADAMIAAHQDDLNGEVLADFSGEGVYAAANDNGIWATGAAVGGNPLD